jgi:hypothetical protein
VFIVICTLALVLRCDSWGRSSEELDESSVLNSKSHVERRFDAVLTAVNRKFMTKTLSPCPLSA